MSDNNTETWGEYQRLVLAELKRLSETSEAQQKQLAHMERDFGAQLAVLKLQAGAWGFIAGAVVTVGSLLLGKA